MKKVKRLKKVCEKCGSSNLKTHTTTYPMKLGAKQLNVERVWVKECMDCHDFKPTKAGEEKIERCVATFMRLFDKHNIDLV